MMGSKLWWSRMVLKVDDKAVSFEEAMFHLIIEHGRFQALAGSNSFEKAQVD